MHRSHLRNGELCSRSLKALYLHKVLEFFCMGNVSLLPFLNLFSQSLISVWTHAYLIYILTYNTILTLNTIFCCSNCYTVTIGNSFSCFLFLFDVPPLLGGFFLNASWHFLHPAFLLYNSIWLSFPINNNDLLIEKYF